MKINLTAKDLERILSALNYQAEYLFDGESVELYGWSKEAGSLENLIKKLEKYSA